MTAVQAVKDASAASIARDTMRIHTVITSSKFTETLDGVQRTGRFGLDITATDRIGQKTTHTATRGDGSILYLDIPDLPDAVRHGKTWVELDLDHLPPAASADRSTSFFATLGADYRDDDPRQGSLFWLAFPDLHKVGVEAKGNRQTVHLAGTVTPSTLPAVPPAGSGITKAYLDSRRTQMRRDRITRISVDLWIGVDGLPVEIKTTTSKATGDDVTDVTPTAWGVPFAMAAPPAADTYVVSGS